MLYKVLKIWINYQGEVDNLLEYSEGTYFGHHRRNAPRHTAMFPVVLWNMFHRTDEEIPRTNNSVEGWLTRFFLSSNFLEIFWDIVKWRKLYTCKDHSKRSWAPGRATKKMTFGLQLLNTGNCWQFSKSRDTTVFEIHCA